MNNEMLQRLMAEAVYPGLLAIVVLIMGLAYRAVQKYLTGLLGLKQEEAALEQQGVADDALRSAIYDEVRHIEQVAKDPTRLHGYTAGMAAADISGLKLAAVKKRLKDRGIDITDDVIAWIEGAVLSLSR